MVTFLSATKKHAAQREPLPQSAPVRRSSFQLRVLRKHSETIQTQMLRCPIAYMTDREVSFRLLRRFSRNTDRTTSKSRWRIHSRKMLLRRVHFTQITMLLSGGSHADRRANDGE